MSYNLHLTHKGDWSDEVSPKKIPLEEFRKYVVKNPNLKIEKEGANSLALEYRRHPSDKDPYFYFAYKDGDIVTTSNHTDKHAFKMLLAISKKFKVPIQGDEGETIDESMLDQFQTYAEMETASKELDKEMKPVLTISWKESSRELSKDIKMINKSLIQYYFILLLCIVTVYGWLFIFHIVKRIKELRKTRNILTGKRDEFDDAVKRVEGCI